MESSEGKPYKRVLAIATNVGRIGREILGHLSPLEHRVDEINEPSVAWAIYQLRLKEGIVDRSDIGLTVDEVLGKLGISPSLVDHIKFEADPFVQFPQEYGQVQRILTQFTQEGWLERMTDQPPRTERIQTSYKVTNRDELAKLAQFFKR